MLDTFLSSLVVFIPTVNDILLFYFTFHSYYCCTTIMFIYIKYYCLYICLLYMYAVLSIDICISLFIILIKYFLAFCLAGTFFTKWNRTRWHSQYQKECFWYGFVLLDLYYSFMKEIFYSIKKNNFYSKCEL